MTNNINYVQGQKFTLYGSGVTLSASSIQLQKFYLPDGLTAITTAMIGTIGYGVLEPGTAQEESISFSGVTQNGDGTATLTGVTRGLQFSTPYTNSASLQKAHAGGTIFIITNSAAFYSNFANKNDDETIPGAWNFPVPVSGTNPATKAYADALAMGGTTTVDRLVVVGTAGETVAAGQVLYLKAADGRWYNATSAASATTDLLQLGIAQGAGTTAGQISGGVLLRGRDSNQTGLTVGVIYYLGTGGAVSASAGTVERVVGQGAGTTSVYFDPEYYYVPTALQKAALAGTSAPSSTNKYVTQAQGGQATATFTANENITANDAVSFNTSSTIAFDAASNGTGTTISHTCAAGASLIVVRKITGTVTGITYAGVAMTLLRSQLSAGADKNTYVFYLANPTTGANNIVITESGSNPMAAAASYTGVGNVSVVDGITAATSKTSVSTVFPVLIPGSWAAMAVFGENGTVACQGISSRSASGSTLVLFDSVTPANGSKRTFSPTFVAGDNTIVSIVIEPSLTTTGVYRSVITSGFPNSFVGFALSSITSAQTGSIVIAGQVSSFSGLSPGRYYYQSSTAGGISLSGSFRPIGYATSATTLLILNN